MAESFHWSLHWQCIHNRLWILPPVLSMISMIFISRWSLMSFICWFRSYDFVCILQSFTSLVKCKPFLQAAIILRALLLGRSESCSVRASSYWVSSKLCYIDFFTQAWAFRKRVSLNSNCSLPWISSPTYLSWSHLSLQQQQYYDWNNAARNLYQYPMVVFHLPTSARILNPMLLGWFQCL